MKCLRARGFLAQTYLALIIIRTRLGRTSKVRFLQQIVKRFERIRIATACSFWMATAATHTQAGMGGRGKRE
jgi:hypothetical protein